MSSSSPIVHCANVPACLNPGTSVCSGCNLVKYCSKSCQSAHWKTHKKDCKSALGQKTWDPDWFVKNRTPAFITDNGPTFQVEQHGLNKHLWGNTAAFDHVQLLKNEGGTWNKHLALCFAASGDLRNVISSINGLPRSFQQPCSIVINDREISVVLRNLLLLLTFASFPVDEAAEIALHLWYSPKLSLQTMTRLRSVLLEKLDKVFSHLARTSSPDETLVKAKFELTDKSAMVALLSRRHWKELKAMLDLKISSEEANQQRHFITLNPKRQDYRDRHLCMLAPFHRVVKMRYYEDGFVLPFGGVYKGIFTEPNFTLFDTYGRWMLNDSQDPLSCWPYDELLSITQKYALPANDLYGALYFHLLAEFRQFASCLQSRQLHFSVLGEDLRQLGNILKKSLATVSPLTFDRIDVSNTSDTCYIGIGPTLTIMRPMLKSPAENPHATLITLFLNYPMEVPISDFIQKGMPNDVIQLVWALLFKDGMTAPPRGKSDPSIIKTIGWKGYLDDCRMQWKQYTELRGFHELGKRMGMKERIEGTIIEKMPYRVKRETQGIDEMMKHIKWLDLAGLRGHECYVEWVRAW